MTLSSRLVAGTLLILLQLTACSQSTLTLEPAPATSSSTPSPSPSIPSSAQSSSSAPTAQLVDPYGGTVVCEKSSDGTLTISQYPKTGGPLRQVLTLRPWDVLAGWRPPVPGDSAVECAHPLLWSPDFRWHLEVGRPPGSTGGNSPYHVALIDVVSKTFVDLTAQRQGTGFSDVVLSETDPMFVSDVPGSRVSFGSNFIVMTSNSFPSGHALVDRRNPTIASEIGTVTGPVGTLIAGHPETILAGGELTYHKVSPDGRYLAEDFVKSIRKAPDFQQQISANCVGNEALSGTFLGWTDPSHLLLTATGSQVVIVDVEALPEPTCQPIIPPTNKSIYQVGLSEDGTTLTFDTDKAGGGRTSYAIPVASPLSEPREVPRNPTSLRTIFRPGNY